MHIESPEIEYDAAYLAAADWFLRLQEPNLSLEDTIEWQRWVQSDLRHQAAFQHVERTWQVLGALPTPRPATAQELRRDFYDASRSVGAWLSSPSAGFLAKLLRQTRFRAAVAASVSFVVSLMLVVLGYYQWAGRTSVIETAIGEVKSVVLRDGSKVELAGHTRIEVSFTPNRRQVSLIYGDAYFAVAKESRRPFSVQMESANITAIGTEFNITRYTDRAVVSVLNGRVRVQPRISDFNLSPQSTNGGSLVNAGHRAIVSALGVEAPTRLGNSDGPAEWRRGRLAFEHESLRYVVEDANRYSKKPIVLANDKTGDLTITGTAAENDISTWISSLTFAFGIQAEEKADRTVLRLN